MNARLSYASRRFDASRVSVELGHEPAIELAGARSEARERRRIPLRWLIGVALTGLTSAALIGSTLYLDLDRKSTFAEEPEFATPPHREISELEGANPVKGDRLVRPVDVVADKQTFTSPMTIKVGDKELLKARPFTLLTTTLTMTPTAFADSVPPFDPLKLSNSGGGRQDVTQDQEPPSDDAEAGFTSRDIAEREAAEVKGELTSSEAQAQINDWVKRQNAGDRLPALAPQMLLMRASHAVVDPLGRALLRHDGLGRVERAVLFDRGAHGAGERHQRSARRPGFDGDFRPGTARAASPRRDLRGRCCAPTAQTAKPRARSSPRSASNPANRRPPKDKRSFSNTTASTGPKKRRRIACVSVYADEQLKAKVAVDDQRRLRAGGDRKRGEWTAAGQARG